MFIAVTSCGVTDAHEIWLFTKAQDANGVPTVKNVESRFVKKKVSKFVKWATPSRNTAYI